MSRIARLLTLAAAAALLWLSGCAQPTELGPTEQPTGEPTRAANPVPAQPTPPLPPVAAPPVQPAQAGSSTADLQGLKAKVAALRSYEMTTTFGGRPVHVWAKLADGKPAKMKMLNPKDGGWMIFDLAAKTMVMFDGKSDYAMRMTMPEQKDSQLPTNIGESIDSMIAQSAQLSTETIDGLVCWKSVSGQGDKQTTVWLDKEYGLPRQVVAPDGTMKLDYQHINAVPDSELEPPAGLTIREMPAPTQPSKPAR